LDTLPLPDSLEDPWESEALCALKSKIMGQEYDGSAIGVPEAILADRKGLWDLVKQELKPNDIIEGTVTDDVALAVAEVLLEHTPFQNVEDVPNAVLEDRQRSLHILFPSSNLFAPMAENEAGMDDGPTTVEQDDGALDLSQSRVEDELANKEKVLEDKIKALEALEKSMGGTE
jgi:hypothetical protein